MLPMPEEALAKAGTAAAAAACAADAGQRVAAECQELLQQPPAPVGGEATRPSIFFWLFVFVGEI
jgi:hypothetical protein